MYSQITQNKRRTIYIMFFFIAFVMVIVWLFAKYLNGGSGVFYGALIGSLVYAFFSYFAGSRMSLALTGAKPVEKKDNPRLYRLVENLAITDGLPTPKVYIIDDPSPNAFATGRKPEKSYVCVTSGLLDIMNDQELEAVLAHELGHIKNYDIVVNMIAFALTAIISLLADIMIRVAFFGGNDREESNQTFIILGIIAAILAPIVATLIQLAISRQREYLADATSVMTTRYPEGLISALTKISQTGSSLKRQNTATAHFFFANPLKGHSITNLFSTHPPIAERISRLKKGETTV